MQMHAETSAKRPLYHPSSSPELTTVAEHTFHLQDGPDLNLALGTELLCLVCAEEGAPAELPAFFTDVPVKYDGALEEGLFMDSLEIENTSPWTFGLTSMDGTLDLGLGWVSSGPQDISQASLTTAAGRPDSDEIATPAREGLPDDRELDALMATLMCR